MSTSCLWRTERPRFPLYSPDGRGRDYYIKFDNGGYWAEQFRLKKKNDYERPHYKSFHTLFHQAAPFKYWGDGHGRETYILKSNGLFHDQKSLCSYKLTDFLRKDNFLYNNYRKNVYMSVSEKKYNNQLRKMERKLIKRLYTLPMKAKKAKKLQLDLDDPKQNIFSSINNIESQEFKNYNNEKFKTIEGTKVYNKDSNESNQLKTLEPESKLNLDENKKGFRFNQTYNNFQRKKLKNLNIKIDNENALHFNNTDKVFRKFLNSNKVNSTINISRKHNHFIFDPRNKNNNQMKINFEFKPKPKLEQYTFKK